MKTWPLAVAILVRINLIYGVFALKKPRNNRTIARNTGVRLALVFLVLAGCRADPTVTLLERQNRLLEDENYRLRGIIEDYESGTAPSCNEVEAGSIPSEQTDITRESGAGGLVPRSRKAPSRQTIQPPTVELPSEAQPPGEVPETLKSPAGLRAPGEPGKFQEPETPNHLEGPSGPALPDTQGKEKGVSFYPASISPRNEKQYIAQGDSKDVGQLVLNRMLTGGYNAAGKSGDEGVRVVFETRDAQGRRIEAPGEVSIVLLDPAKTGEAARLARWDFTAAETATLFRGRGVSRGMYIECPWPDNPPEHSRLHLFVRYLTRDGRKLQVDQPIEVALPGENISRWTPAATTRQAVDLTDGRVTSQSIAQQGEVNSINYSTGDDSSHDRSMRSASQSNNVKLKRPVWSPDRY